MVIVSPAAKECKNDAKLSHTNVKTIKSTVGYSETSSILTASEKHPPYKIFDYSVRIYFARYHTPLKNFVDNPPTPNDKDKYPSQCLFSHNMGINTMICFTALFSPLLSSTQPHIYSQDASSQLNISYGRVILYTARACACVYT